MCGGVHYGKVVGVVSVERWSCGRGVRNEEVEMATTDRAHPLNIHSLKPEFRLSVS